jgi:hypothetical protein
MELLSGHEKMITKSGISLNAGTLNRGFTVHSMAACSYLVPEVQQVITHDDFLPKLKAQKDVQSTLHNTNRN